MQKVVQEWSLPPTFFKLNKIGHKGQPASPHLQNQTKYSVNQLCMMKYKI